MSPTKAWGPPDAGLAAGRKKAKTAATWVSVGRPLSGFRAWGVGQAPLGPGPGPKPQSNKARGPRPLAY